MIIYTVSRTKKKLNRSIVYNSVSFVYAIARTSIHRQNATVDIRMQADKFARKISLVEFAVDRVSLASFAPAPRQDVRACAPHRVVLMTNRPRRLMRDLHPVQVSYQNVLIKLIWHQRWITCNDRCNTIASSTNKNVRDAILYDNYFFCYFCNSLLRYTWYNISSGNNFMEEKKKNLYFARSDDYK